MLETMTDEARVALLRKRLNKIFVKQANRFDDITSAASGHPRRGQAKKGKTIVGTNKKRRAKLSKTVRSVRLYYRDDQDIFNLSNQTGEDFSIHFREVVYDGLLYRRLLAGIPDTENGKPAEAPMSVSALHESLTDRLGQLEEGLREMLSTRGSVPPDGMSVEPSAAIPEVRERESARREALAYLLTDPGFFEEMFAPLAEHLHLLRVESEFTFRLAYCIREFTKRYLVRHQLEAQLPSEKRPAPGAGQDSNFVKELEALMVAEQIEYDGRAQVALKAIRSGKIHELQPG
jgi:hypothetical protein